MRPSTLFAMVELAFSAVVGLSLLLHIPHWGLGMSLAATMVFAILGGYAENWFSSIWIEKLSTVLCCMSALILVTILVPELWIFSVKTKNSVGFIAIFGFTVAMTFLSLAVWIFIGKGMPDVMLDLFRTCGLDDRWD